MKWDYERILTVLSIELRAILATLCACDEVKIYINCISVASAPNKAPNSARRKASVLSISCTTGNWAFLRTIKSLMRWDQRNVDSWDLEKDKELKSHLLLYNNLVSMEKSSLPSQMVWSWGQSTFHCFQCVFNAIKNDRSAKLLFHAVNTTKTLQLWRFVTVCEELELKGNPVANKQNRFWMIND